MEIGFRFRPSDREIINDYLIKRMDGHDYSYVVRDIDLCRSEPWELPGISVLKDEEVWYFFCRPENKYRNSKKANRATRSGFWKPTGKVRPIRGPGGAQIGTKRTLVFYSKTGSGSASGRTPWVIHEYQVQNVLPGQREFLFCKLKDKADELTNNISVVEEAEQDVQAGYGAGCDTPSAAITLQEDLAQIQRALDASDSEFDSQGITGDDWSQLNHLLFESSEEEVDPLFADSLLIEPVESGASDVGHRENLQQVGSSRMNDQPASARKFARGASVQTIYQSSPPSSHDVNQSRLVFQSSEAVEFRHEPEEPELLESSDYRPYQKVSPTRQSDRLVLFASATSTKQAKEYKHRNYPAPKVKPVREKKSVSNTKESSFVRRNTVPSHQPTTPFVYIVNLIAGLVLLIVVIMHMMQFFMSQNHSEFSDDFELPDRFYGRCSSCYR